MQPDRMPKGKRTTQWTGGPTPISLEGFYSFFDIEECLIFIARALERAKAGDPDAALAPYQRKMFNDLTRPLDEDALASMLEYWNFDITRLIKRGRRGWGRDIPAKPRIDVRVEITSKGNFKAEWFPRGWNQYDDEEGGRDIPIWHRFENRSGGFDSRPSNELFFIHGVDHALEGLTSPYPIYTRILDHPLLCACEKVVDRLKSRLEDHFDIRMLSDVFVSWQDQTRTGDNWRSDPDQIATWEIADPEARKIAAELAELECMEAKLGFSEIAFREARAFELSRRRKSGPPPEPHTLSDRLTRALKSAGHTATKTKVERAMYLVERYRDKVVPIASR